MSDSTTTGSPASTLPAFKSLLRPAFWLGGNWKKAIEQSELPADIQAIIHQVVSRSRLMRREKYDVAEELIQHFQDGNRQGTSFDKLKESFGDPKSAALLIRRSKIRNRSIWLSAGRMASIIALCVFISYLLLLWWFYSGQPVPSVDYIPELNRNVMETEEKDKAWPLYRPMWTKFQFSEGGRGRYVDLRNQHIYGGEWPRNERLARPSDEQWPQVIAMLSEHKELLDVFREGATRKSFGLVLQANPVDYSDEDFAALYPHGEKELYLADENSGEILEGAAIQILLPHVQSFRTAARMFHLDSRHAATQGDFDRIDENVGAVLGLARQVTDTKFYVNTLVGFAVAGLGLAQLEEAVTSDPDFLSETHLARLQKRVEQMDVQAWLDCSSERACFKDILQRCYTDDGNGDGRITAAGMKFLRGPFFEMIAALPSNNGNAGSRGQAVSSLDRMKQVWRDLITSDFAESATAPAVLLTCASRKQTLEKAEELFDETEADFMLPFWKSRNAKVDGWKDRDDFFDNQAIEYPLVSTVFPATEQVRNVRERLRARQNGVILALAAYRYHLQHNKWPTKAEELVGDYLKEVPVDILTGQPLRFRIEDNQPLIYSVGLDYDDDGGVDATVETEVIQRDNITPGPKDNSFEGDWILWPQVIPGGKSFY